MASQRFTKGFTLIEVLVVLLIMGVVLSMISLASTSKDPLEDTLKKSQGFQYWFGKIIDQSLLSGEDVGLYFTQSSIVAMAWREGELDNSEPEVVWESHAQIQPFTIPEELKLELFLDIELSNWIELKSTQDETEVFLEPHIVVTPSEEYFPSFLINFYNEDYIDEQVVVIADGYNRARLTRVQK